MDLSLPALLDRRPPRGCDHAGLRGLSTPGLRSRFPCDLTWLVEASIAFIGRSTTVSWSWRTGSAVARVHDH
jgi:hypothetical protein